MTEEPAGAGLRPGQSPGLVAVVIVAAFLGWMAAAWIGGAVGLPSGVALALDLVCLGVLGWALMSLIGIWRMRRDEGR